jgi:hypothetical protein
MNRSGFRYGMSSFTAGIALLGLAAMATPAAAQSSQGEMACQNDAYRLCDRSSPTAARSRPACAATCCA